MSFEPLSIQQEFSKGGGGIAILLHTPFKYFESHLSGLATGCLTNALMCSMVGVDLASRALAQRAIEAADLSIERKNDSNYTAHWTEASCHYCKSIAHWTINDNLDMSSLKSATTELDTLLNKPQKALHKSDVEWGLFAYVLDGDYDNYTALGKKYGLKPFVQSITSDHAYGHALIQYAKTPSEKLIKKLTTFVKKRTMYFVETGCHYHAVMLTVLLGYITMGSTMSTKDAVLKVYDIIRMQYPGEASYEPDPAFVEFAKNR